MRRWRLRKGGSTRLRRCCSRRLGLGRCADGLGPPAFFCAPLLPADDVAFGEVWARQLRGMRRAKRGQGGLGLQCAKRGQVLICFAPHWLQRRRRLADGQVYAPATTAPRKNGSLLRKEQ